MANLLGQMKLSYRTVLGQIQHGERAFLVLIWTAFYMAKPHSRSNISVGLVYTNL